MSSPKREIGRYVVAANGKKTVWSYVNQHRALSLAERALQRLPKNLIGTATTGKRVRHRGKKSVTSFVPMLVVNGVNYQVALAFDGETPLELRRPARELRDESMCEAAAESGAVMPPGPAVIELVAA